MTEWVAFTVETEHKVATVTLTGPGKGNAMGPDFWSELPRLFAALDTDPEVAAIVITGSGRNFSVGLDLITMGPPLFQPLLADKALAAPRTEFLHEVRRLQASITAVAECRKPVVAAIHGWCIGGGLDLIAAVDIRYASADAKFSLREARVAIVADVGSLNRLPAIIGDGHLRELAFTGKDIDARRAQQIGLVNDIFDDADTALAAAHETAREIAANPTLVVQGIKDVLGRERAAIVSEGLKYVAAWNAAFLPSEDLTEAIEALFDKRKPRFTGN